MTSVQSDLAPVLESDVKNSPVCFIYIFIEITGF